MSPALKLAVVCWLGAGCRLGFDNFAVGVVGADVRIDASPDAPPQGVVRTFGERPTSQTQGVTTDTTISEMLAMMAMGDLEDGSVSGAIGTLVRTLVRFELSSVPPGTTVFSAQLVLTRLDFGDEVPGDLAVRTVTNSWDELQATWNSRMTGMAWSTVGGSLGATINTVTVGDPFVIDLPAAVVQGWIDTPASNAGVALTPADELLDTHYHFIAREGLSLADRPQLVLDLGL